MRNIFLTVLLGAVIILLIIVGFIVFKKAGEGEECLYTSACSYGLKCINGACSSGKSGSFCDKVADCTTAFCINNICSDGKDGEFCNTYADCNENYLCEKSKCEMKPPVYSWPDYFTKLELQKMKAEMAPGPNNIPINATEFKTTDGINLNISVKAKISGEIYFEALNSVTGQVVFSNPKFEASGNLGRGFPAPKKPGDYQVKVYFNGELVDVIDFKVI